ncbi:MAG: hypothetical protein ACO1RX_03625 [Candidatus Sericytochromatia bacterium]
MATYLTLPISRHFWQQSAVLVCLGVLAACGAEGSLSAAGLPANNPVTVKNTALSSCAQEVAEVTLNAQSRSAQLNTELVSPGAFKHRYKVITIDTTALSGGTLRISGQVGTRAQGSFALMGAAPAYPCTGVMSESALGSATNLEPGKSFEITHAFSSGQVFRLLAEGSWHDPEDTLNSASLTIRAE